MIFDLYNFIFQKFLASSQLLMLTQSCVVVHILNRTEEPTSRLKSITFFPIGIFRIDLRQHYRSVEIEPFNEWPWKPQKITFKHFIQFIFHLLLEWGLIFIFGYNTPTLLSIYHTVKWKRFVFFSPKTKFAKVIPKVRAWLANTRHNDSIKRNFS